MRVHAAALCSLFVAFVSVANQATAQTLLRWKLKAGESLHVAIEQQTDSQVSFSGKSAATKIELTLVLGWNVIAADDAGFKIRQSIDRIHQKLATQQAGTIEFDSASSAKPTGQSRELAESLRPLIGAEFEMRMTPRGEITSMQPANDSAKALIAALEKDADGDAAAKSAVEQMLRRPLLVLPEKPVNVGESWSVSSEHTTAAGPLKIETNYTLASLSTAGGKPVGQIAMTAKVLPGSSGSVSVKSHEHSGQVEFNVDQGRVVKIHQDQKLTSERPYRETTIVVSLSSKQTTTVATRQ